MEITVKHEPSSGAAVIEIRGADVSETRFRLRDPFSEKYLTRRGWTKTASFLPAEATSVDGVLTLTMDADLARKITPGINLSLEQPSGFQEILTWPSTTVAPDVEEMPEPEPVASEPVTVKEPTPEAVIPESFEPTILDDHPHANEKPVEELKAAPLYTADNDDRPQSWKPAVIAAALFLVLGLGLGYFLLGSDSAAVKQAQQAAAMQIEKQKWEFDRQLAAAREEASASIDKSKASDTQIASLTSKSEQLAADRDAAQKALADKNKSIEALQKQLDDANAQIAAVKDAAGDEAKAQIGALDQKIASMTAELDKASADLAQRDETLRDTQAKLTEATDQIAANRETAKQEAEAQNTSLSEQMSTLTAEVEKGKQQQAAQERALKDAQANLARTSDELVAAREAAKNQATTQTASLTAKINTLTAQVKQGEQQITERDTALRDVQSKLSVANIQIDALKVFAGKTTEAGLEKNAMSEKLKQLTAELDKTSQSLSDREQALTEATARLRDTETKLTLAGKRNEELLAGQTDAGQTQTQPVADDTASRLQEERDLYANELKTMTSNFSALQSEKTGLEKTVAELQAKIKETGLTTSQVQSKSVWGATAIDRNGAIYSLQNQTGQKLAQDNVTALCNGKSRSRCESLTTYSNACFSVARFRDEGPASDNYAYFVHKDWKTASQTALERCESMGTACTVRFTACSPDALSKPVSE